MPDTFASSLRRRPAGRMNVANSFRLPCRSDRLGRLDRWAPPVQPAPPDRQVLRGRPVRQEILVHKVPLDRRGRRALPGQSARKVRRETPASQGRPDRPARQVPPGRRVRQVRPGSPVPTAQPVPEARSALRVRLVLRGRKVRPALPDRTALKVRRATRASRGRPGRSARPVYRARPAE